MKSYKIVWFDDEVNTSLESIKMQFDDYGIDYVGFENAEEGIKHISSKFQSLDAIVIDGNFFKNKGDKAIDDSGKALNMVVDCLKEIKFKKEIPYFILSGKFNFSKYKNPLMDLLGIDKVYDKLGDTDLDELCKTIIAKTNKSPIGSLKIKYHDAFVMCTEGRLGEECFEKIVSLAQSLEDPILKGSSEDLFITIRKILEKLFVHLSKINIIDPDLLLQKGWINGCSLFLSNRHSAYINNTDIHPVIQDSIFRLLNITQDSAHAEGGLRIKVDEYCSQYRGNYLYKSSVNLLFEILSYFDNYISDHTDLSENHLMWRLKDIIHYGLDEDIAKLVKGTVINHDLEKDFAFFKPDIYGNNVFIPKYLVKNYSLSNGMQIFAEIEDYIDNRTNELKSRVKSIEINK